MRIEIGLYSLEISMEQFKNFKLRKAN